MINSEEQKQTDHKTVKKKTFTVVKPRSIRKGVTHTCLPWELLLKTLKYSKLLDNVDETTQISQQHVRANLGLERPSLSHKTRMVPVLFPL